MWGSAWLQPRVYSLGWCRRRSPCKAALLLYSFAGLRAFAHLSHPLLHSRTQLATSFLPCQLALLVRWAAYSSLAPFPIRFPTRSARSRVHISAGEARRRHCPSAAWCRVCRVSLCLSASALAGVAVEWFQRQRQRALKWSTHSYLTVLVFGVNRTRGIGPYLLPSLLSGDTLTCVVPTYVTQSLSYLVWLEADICHRSFWHLSGHMVP